jgi:hypothetical protein
LFVAETLRFVQNGHPAPRLRLFGFARQTWSSPSGHRHQIIRAEPALTVSGVKVPFLERSHSSTRRGKPDTQ